MLVKCNCNNCPAHLEFESSNAGSVVVCPKCGMETKLYIPTVQRPPPPQGLPIPPEPAPKPSAPPAQLQVGQVVPTTGSSPGQKRELTLSVWGGRVVCAFLAVVGVALVLWGCGNELAESSRRDGSAVRQTVYAIQYGTGFVLLGLAAIIELLTVIARK